MEWDADNFEPPAPVVPVNIVGGAKLNKWEGEDEEENIKDSWDAEEEETKKPETKIPEKKTKSKLEQKIAERERKQEVENEKMRRKFLEAEENSNMTPEEKKLLQQKLQEEADFEVAKEMLGVDDEGDEDSIDKMNPKSKEDFSVFEQALLKKITQFSKSEHYSDFIEDHIRNLSVTLSMSDLRKLKATVDNINIEKIKAEKGDKSKKNKGKGKAKLRLDNSAIQDYDEFSAYTVDDYDEFM